MDRLIVALAALAAGCGGSPQRDCHGLSLGDCRVTDGCMADRCDGCGCATSYRGCLATTETPASCPGLGCPSGICCSSEVACASGAGMCTAPDATAGCGACNPASSTCATDADCGTAMICEPIACSCGGNRACVAGCVDDSSCAEGTACEVATARCTATACAGDGDCPSNFQCDQQRCARRACSDDLACDGYCVEGACFAQRGECRQPAP